MSRVCFWAVLISFCSSAFLGPFLIPRLKKMKIGQTVREDGPSAHLVKNGTPTMGGLLILLSVTITTLVFMRDYPNTTPVLLLTVGFGVVGFFDDYIKVVGQSSMGLTPLQKLSGQVLVTGVFLWYLLRFTNVSLAMKIPFLPGAWLDFGWLNIPFLFLVVMGTANGVNFTDGLDGLAGSVTAIVAVFFTVVAIGTDSGIEPVTCAVTGAIMGFLLFNVHPAAVFMGDTGSLALGGFVAACGYVLQMPLFLVIVGIVYLCEVLSVIFQVGWYKLSGGRRLFKMAPLHHHFELNGWSETRVTALFTIVTTIACLIALMGMN